MKEIKFLFIIAIILCLTGCGTKESSADVASAGDITTVTSSTDSTGTPSTDLTSVPATPAPSQSDNQDTANAASPATDAPSDTGADSQAAASDSVPSDHSQNSRTDTEDTLGLTLYVYGPDDYENPLEEKVIYVSRELYENDLAEALNKVFDETSIRISSAVIDIDTKRITVDLSQDIALKFNAGSCAGIILTNELIRTLLNLPDIESAVITVDGVKDYEADHFSFRGVFTKGQG